MSTRAAKAKALYAIVSPDRFLRLDALARLLEELGDQADALGPARFDGDSTEAAVVLDEVRTPSLLGARRVVIVHDADDFISANRAVLERYCARPAECGTLILVCQSMPRTTRLYKIINECGEVRTLEALKKPQVVPWITARARSTHGKRMGPAAAELLREQLGDSPGVLDAELAKLATYAGDRAEIVAADVEAITGCHREENVFAVTDALMAGNVAAALGAWEQVLATDRAAPGRALGGLAWGVRRLLEARREWEAGGSLTDLSKRMFTSPDVLRRRLERVSTAKLETQQRDLLDADVAVKTGAATLESVIERFIVTHCAR
ncbi:MAG: DNA polymerase III subunit delta [Planctomycetes bacterium]|nr:DNA polymerase III subunit delta [Planctomycetota bacterium]